MNISRRPWQSFVAAILLVAVAAILRLWPLQALGVHVPWLTFYPAVIVIALYGGFVAGALGALLSCLTVLFLLPIFSHQPMVRDIADWLALAVFFVTATAISGMAEAMRRFITGEKTAEAEYDRLFALSLDLLCIANADGYFKRVNPAFTQTLGWSTEEMLARPFLEFVHPDDREATLNEVKKQVVAGEKVMNFVNRYRHKDGSWRWLSWKSVPQPGGLMYASARDVTDLKQAEEALRQAQEETAREKERLQFIFESAPVGLTFTLIEPDGRTTRLINDAHLRISGITREQADEQGIFKRITHPDDWPAQEELGRQLDAGTLDRYAIDKRYVRPDGQVVWAFFSFKQRNYPDGRREGLSVAVDITQRKQAEEALRQAQEETAVEKARLQFIFDSVPVGLSFAKTEPDGRTMRMVNEAQLRIWGITREEADEEGIFKRITHPDDWRPQDEFARQLAVGAIEQCSMDKRYIRKDGRIVWAFFTFKQKNHADGSREGLCVAVDITSRKQTEEALLRSEENLSVTLQSIGDGVLATDAAGLVTRLNPIAEKMTGWTQADALGRAVSEVFRIINEETHQPAPIPVEEVLATGEIHGLANHTVIIARDGTELPIADSAAPIRDKDGNILGVVLVFRDVTQEREADKAIRESESRLREHNEELEERVQKRTTELVNANRDLMAEIARRRHAEGQLGKLNAELEQRVQDRTRALEEANKELEAFSYSVSHDLRAPLRHIQGYVALLEAEAGKKQFSEKAQRFLKVIGDSGMSMGDLIDDLLAFSKMSRTEMNERPVRLDELVRESMEQLEMAVKGRNIVWKIPPLPAVMGDQPMLRQVFANLLGNAVKYSRPRDPAEIEVGHAGHEDGRIIFFVRDNGVGFEMEYAQKLFGVFQRLHRASEFEGTGIGLANVRRIISRHGGRTWAEGELNKGATFYFTLRPSES